MDYDAVQSHQLALLQIRIEGRLDVLDIKVAGLEERIEALRKEAQLRVDLVFWISLVVLEATVFGLLRRL